MKLEDVLISEFYKINQESVNSLKGRLGMHKEWALCLGAGVSQSCGLPGWGGLLSKIQARMFTVLISATPAEKSEFAVIAAAILKYMNKQKDKDGFIRKMKMAYEGKYSEMMDGFNNLEAAEYMLEFIETYAASINGGDKKELINHLIAEIIQDCCKIDALPPAKDEGKFTTLSAIVELMTLDKKAKIHTAFTYNYDDLLESGLREYKKKDNVNSFVPENRKAFSQIDFMGDEWNIFHIHGRVPVLGNSKETIDGRIILTETSYYEEEKQGYSLTNSIQSYAMNNYNLIYIGFSGADYSFRRIIKDLSKNGQDGNEKYIFFCVDDIVKSVIKAIHKKELENGEASEKLINSCVNKKNNNYEKLLINQLLSSKKEYWKSHGLKTIWSTLEELPQDLAKLNQ